MKYFIVILFTVFAREALCQNNFGIGTNSPSPDAILELKSSTQGVLIPRLSTAQRLAIVSPTNGLIVYDSNFNCFYYYISSAAAWKSVCPGPVGPPINSNVQVFTSQGVSTYINSSTPATVNGLSLAVTITDTATVILYSNGNIRDSPAGPGAGLQTLVQLYQNAVPITGTAQSNDFTASYSSSPPPTADMNWNVSTVLSLTPGTYLFELKATHIGGDDFYAACNHSSQNQGILTAEVIYK